LAPSEKEEFIIKKGPAPVQVETELHLLCPDCNGDVRYGAKVCPQCGKAVDEGFRVIRRPAGPHHIESYPMASSSYKRDENEFHRTKEFSFLFSTYTVDYDDPQNFFTVHRERIMGQEITTVNDRDWYVSMGVISLIAINVFMVMFMFGAMANGAPTWFLTMIAVIWALAVLPALGFYLWVLRPPDDYPSSS
jgi:hypothetical protein